MVDISNLPPPPTKESKVDISGLPPPPKESSTWKDIGGHLSAGARGLSSELLGLPGAFESMVTPEGTGELKGHGTVLPTPEEIRGGYEKAGWAEPEKKYQPSQTLGEIVPAVVGGAQLLKSGLKLGTDYLGKNWGKLTGKESATLGKEAEALGSKVKSETAAGVTERAAAERKAAEEAAAKAKELQSPQNPVLQSQKDITGATSAVSQKLIADKKRATQETQSALSKLGNKIASEEEVGGLIQPLGKDNIDKIKKVRQEKAITEQMNPAFKRAREREFAGQFVESAPESKSVFDEAKRVAEEQISRVGEPYASKLRARYSTMLGKERQMTEAEARVEQLRASIEGREPKLVAHDPMTLDQGEHLVRQLRDKDLALAEGFSADDVAKAHQLADKLEVALNKFEPGRGAYKKAYQEESVALNRAEAGRAGKFAQTAHVTPEEETIFASDKAATGRYFLDGTKEKAQRLVDLVGGKPKELVDAIAGNIRGKMEKMSAAQAQEFVNKGMFEVFPELRESANAVVKAKQAEEKVASLLSKQGAAGAGSASGRLGKALGTQSNIESKLAQSAKSATLTAERAQDAARKFETFNTHLGTLSGEDSLKKSKQFLTDMAKDGHIPQAAYQKSLQEIQQAEEAYKRFKDAETLKKSLRRALTYKALTVGVGGGTAYYFTH